MLVFGACWRARTHTHENAHAFTYAHNTQGCATCLSHVKGELEEMLMQQQQEGAAMPSDIADLIERRQHGAALLSAIHAGDSAAALAVIAAHPRAAWIRADDASASGGYPLHAAALAGLGEVVEALSAIPGNML